MRTTLHFELEDPKDTEAVCAYVGNGIARHSSFYARGGALLMITHASEDGKFKHGILPAHLRADIIICCYPGLAKKRYPQLAFVGDWEMPTKARVIGDCLYVFSWDPDYEPGC